MADYATRFENVEFAVGPPKSYFELHGERYVYETLTHVGLKTENGPPISLEESADMAWGAYWTELSRYLKDHKASFVFWRVEPMLEESGRRYWIRSRLVVVERRNG